LTSSGPALHSSHDARGGAPPLVVEVAVTAYREQTYVERSAVRCFCDAVTTRSCACCRRPRCRDHLARGLCDRCHQAVARSEPTHATWSWLTGAVAGVSLALGTLLALGSASGVLLGIPLAVAVGAATRQALIRRSIRALRPRLATTVGELPASIPDQAFPKPSDDDLKHVH
jgi:hypothetical protein